MNTLYKGDSLDLIPNFEDSSIDLVLTDPPYNISKDNNFETMKTGARDIDFGEWDYEFNQLDWIGLIAPKVKKGGSIIIFNALENLGDIKLELEKHGFIFKEFINWVKTNPMPRNRDRLYVTARETAIWAVKKGDKWTFNRQRENYENGYFTYPTVHHTKRIHPTQKPEPLMSDLIKIHSNVNNLIVDPFSGSGSTIVTGYQLGRHVIGIEKDVTHFKNSTKRFNRAKEEIETKET